MKPLILGEAPSRTGDRYWRYPLSGEVGKRLCTMAGIATQPPDPEHDDYGAWYWALKRQYDLTNVITRYPGGRPGYGALFPPAEATKGFNRLVDTGLLCRDRVVVCLGKRVLALFIKEDAQFYRWKRFRGNGWRVVAIPHPSRLNRLYNDPDQVELAAHALRVALRKAQL